VLTLPHYLRPGLRLVCIGYNPSIYSAEAGHYYARPGNVFWRQMSASGLVDRTMGPEEDALLMDEAGIGFTDLCPRPTVRAEHLSPAEIAEGAVRLREELAAHQPAMALFSGRGIYQHFARYALGVPARDLAARGYGEQPERVSETRLWVIPSSSGLASKWHRERLELLRRLAKELASAPTSANCIPLGSEVGTDTRIGMSG
jgi:TDG/mug DNA glycosylase family protein